MAWIETAGCVLYIHRYLTCLTCLLPTMEPNPPWFQEGAQISPFKLNFVGVGRSGGNNEILDKCTTRLSFDIGFRSLCPSCDVLLFSKAKKDKESECYDLSLLFPFFCHCPS